MLKKWHGDSWAILIALSPGSGAALLPSLNRLFWDGSCRRWGFWVV
ncbi:hypothetical protein [Streptomyces sp. NPDC002276]